MTYNPGLPGLQPKEAEHGLLPAGFSPTVELSHTTLEDASLSYIANLTTANLHLEAGSLREYAADMDELFLHGVEALDTQTRVALHDGRRRTLAQFVSQNKILYDSVLQGSRGRRDMQTGPLRGKNPAQIAADPLNRRWVQAVERDAAEGFYRSDVLMAAAAQLQLVLAPDMRLTDSERQRMAVGGLPGLHGDTNPDSQAVTFTDAANELRTMGVIDLSFAAIDGKVEAFSALVAVEVPALALSDLFEMAALGGKYAEKALALYGKYGDQLLTNPHTSYDLLIELAEYNTAAARRVPPTDRYLKRAVKAMAGRAEATVAHMDRFVGLLRSAYDTRGYVYPPSLRPEDYVPPTLEIAPETPAEITEAEVAADGVAARLRDEIIERMLLEKLDVIVFPDKTSGASGEDFESRLEKIAKEVAGITEGADEQVILDRLRDLSAVSKVYDGRLFISKKKALSSTFPYFLCFFRNSHGRQVCIAETPIYRHATYVLDGGHMTDTIMDVLAMRRSAAQAAGAVPIRHSAKYPHGSAHQQKIHDVIFQLTLTNSGQAG